MRRFTKLATWAIVCFFSIGTLFVALVARSPSRSLRFHHVGKFHAVRFHGSFQAKPPQLDGKMLETAMLVEEDPELPDLSQGHPVSGKSMQFSLEGLLVTPAARAVFNPRVSTYIFQSVLNL